MKAVSAQVKEKDGGLKAAEESLPRGDAGAPEPAARERARGPDAAGERGPLDPRRPGLGRGRTPSPHWDIPGFSKLFDFERGSKVTGAGFPFFIGEGARLVRALINFFLEEDAKAGYVEVSPPIFVNAASATATGQLPDKEGQMYETTPDRLFAVPTAEVPLTNFFRDEILEEAALPSRRCAYTPCFRREAGSYGKDVRGLNRLHQFDKVELLKWVHPSASYDELDLLKATSRGSS
jgi:seryl-tRNA synthetase